MPTRKGPPHSFGWLKIGEQHPIMGIGPILDMWELPDGGYVTVARGKWIEIYPNGAITEIDAPSQHKFRHA